MSQTLDDEGRNASATRAPWTGWRPFVVESRRRESDVITSFVLRPDDGEAIASHRPGQHLTFLMGPDVTAPLKRNYSISAAPNGETYRISVKRDPEGQISKWLHDEARPGTIVQVMPPSGSFVLRDDQTRPVVLLSAGVGLTPMISMMETIAGSRKDLAAHFVHCTRDGTTHAFREHVRNLASQKKNISVTTFYSQPRESNVIGRDFDIVGRINLDWLRKNTPLENADYFVCGPIPFLRMFVGGLAEAGVPVSRIHYEFFGPIEELLDEAPELADFPSDATPADYTPPAKPYGQVKNSMIQSADIGQALLDSAADAVVASDREGLIVLWNPGAERIFGFSEAEAIGQSLDIIIPEQFRERHWDGYRETVASGQSRYGAGDLLAVPGQHKDGRRISLEFTIVLLKDANGRVEGMASVMRDVTKRFLEAKALRKQIAELTSSKAG